MVKPGATVILRPFKRYPNEPEKNVDFLVSERDGRRSVYFQAIDTNRDPRNQRRATGFYNICILTEQELQIGDKVVIKSIIGVKLFPQKRTVQVTIMERGEKRSAPIVIDGYTIGEEDF